jgi:hypothetical protein
MKTPATLTPQLPRILYDVGRYITANYGTRGASIPWQQSYLIVPCMHVYLRSVRIPTIQLPRLHVMQNIPGIRGWHNGCKITTARRRSLEYTSMTSFRNVNIRKISPHEIPATFGTLNFLPPTFVIKPSILSPRQSSGFYPSHDCVQCSE